MTRKINHAALDWRDEPSANYVQVGECWHYRPWVPAWARRAYMQLPSWRLLRPLRWALMVKAFDCDGMWPKIEVSVTTYPPGEEPEWLTDQTYTITDWPEEKP